MIRNIFVVVNIEKGYAGYAVIAYPTYAEARDWRLRHSKPENYKIDCVGFVEHKNEATQCDSK